MGKLSLVAIMLTCFVGLLSCRHDSQQSSVKDISTDLSESDGNAPGKSGSGPVQMYWVADAEVVRGVCADRKNVIRSNCNKDLRSMDVGSFKRALDGGLAATADLLIGRLIEIESAIDQLQEQSTDLRAAIDSTATGLGATESDLTAAKTELVKLSTFIADYHRQLKSIKQRLAAVRDADLKAQAAQLSNEMADLWGQVIGVGGQISGLQGNVVKLEARLTMLQSKLEVIGLALRSLDQQQSATNAALTIVFDDLAAYSKTLDMLQDPDGINFRVQSDNPWYAKVRQFVRRFDAIFAAQGS